LEKLTAGDLIELREHLRNELIDAVDERRKERFDEEFLNAVSAAVNTSLEQRPITDTMKVRLFRAAAIIVSLLGSAVALFLWYQVSKIATEAAQQAAKTQAESTATSIAREIATTEAREAATFIRAQAVSDSLIENVGFREAVTAGLVNSLTGAVVAFDIEDGCPEGWDSYSEVWGRVIVGAATEDELGEIPGDFRSDSSGEDLIAREFRQPGGSQQTKLNIENIPSHSHGIEWRGTNSAIQGEAGGRWGVSTQNMSAETFPTGGDPETGETVPFGNMPPYVALHYCKKG